MMGDGPIFVTGLPRTGKTPLRTVLGRHRRLSLTRKTRMWTKFYGSFGDLSDAKSLERCLETMMSDPDVRRLESDETAVRYEFARRPQTYPHLFGVFHSQYAERQGRARWGEQVGFLEEHAVAIFEAWPEASIIHMVRRPDSWVGPAGLVSKPGSRRRELEQWRKSCARAIENREKYPSGYLIVRYEDLAAAPVATLSQVCSFIGEVPTVEMCDIVTPIVASALVETTARRTSASIERAARPMLSLLGYPDEPGGDADGRSSKRQGGDERPRWAAR